MSTVASTEASEHRSPGTSSTPLMETEGISSWNFEKTPIAVPYGVVVRQSPTRRLHEKHVAKLEGFLSDVEHHPVALEHMIASRRKALPKCRPLGEESEDSEGNVEIAF
ncbi:unnamed protein product [Symbiodinium sp. CCMP2456]|nr:unnamed protein product [Symbiodinium sp. CCMP2456]